MTTAATATATDVTVRDTSITKGLLGAGVIAGPVFVGATLVQAATREGFDPVVHPLSLLSQSGLGWMQITNFIVCGLLAFAGSQGLRRAYREGPGRRWAPILFAAYGIALVWGGVFVADPAFGYPVGTPDGAPESQSWHSILHSFAPVAATFTLVAACVVLARRFASEGRKAWAGVTVAVAVANLALTGASFAAADYRLMFAGGAVIWLWAAAVTFDARVRIR